MKKYTPPREDPPYHLYISKFSPNEEYLSVRKILPLRLVMAALAYLAFFIGSFTAYFIGFKNVSLIAFVLSVSFILMIVFYKLSLYYGKLEHKLNNFTYVFMKEKILVKQTTEGQVKEWSLYFKDYYKILLDFVNHIDHRKTYFYIRFSHSTETNKDIYLYFFDQIFYRDFSKKAVPIAKAISAHTRLELENKLKAGSTNWFLLLLYFIFCLITFFMILNQIVKFNI